MSEPVESQSNGKTPTVDEQEQTAEIELAARNTSRKLLSLLALGAVLFLIIHVTPLGERVRNWDTLTKLLAGGGPEAAAYFVVISTVLIALGTPRLLFYALGGLVFGLWQGLIWSTVSSVVGSFLTFRAARWGSREWLIERFGQNRFFSRIAGARPTTASVALMRMLPVSNVIINVALALSRVGNRAFVLGSLIGFLPQGVVAVVIGSGIAHDVPWAGAIQIGVAATLLLGILYWTSKKRRKPPEPEATSDAQH